VAGKLSCLVRLAAVAAGSLIHIMDESSGSRFLVDTGASYSIVPHVSSAPATGPRLFGPDSQPIKCWGEKILRLQFQGRVFSWPFLLAAVDFPILGVDFLKRHGFMVDPANSRLVDRQGQSFATVARPNPPRASVVTGLHQQHSDPRLPTSPSVSSPSSASAPSTSSPSGFPSSGFSSASSYKAILDDFPGVVNVSQR
jgi:hypothetical protein